MFLKNYTSKVPVGTTIQNIVTLLVKIGVSQITMDYRPDGSIAGIIFSANIEGRLMPIKIPVNVEAAWNALWQDYCGMDKPHKVYGKEGDEETYNGRKRLKKSAFKEQGARTAWKLMQDWLEVQVSMIQLQQAEIMQVFLPYAWDGKRSYFAALKADHFAALLPPKETEVVV